MVKASSIPTRVAGDIAAKATSVAAAENRSAAEQISHWARIGMQIERAGSIATRRVLAVAAGEEQFTTLSDDERSIAHSHIDARIGELAVAQSFGASARADGHVTVSIDDDGTLIEISPDGSRRSL